MLEFIKKFLTNYLFPIVKQAVAQAVVNQIEDAVYGPRPVRRYNRGGYIPPRPQHVSERFAESDED